MKQGFFPSSMLISEKQGVGTVPKCGPCGLLSKCKTPKMGVNGNGRRKILICGEAPGCISGDSLIEVAYRDKLKYPDGIRIKDLVGKKFKVYSFDINKQDLVLGNVRRVWLSGRKKVYKITFEWEYAFGGRHVILEDSIKVTGNHPFLIRKWERRHPYNARRIKRDCNYLSINQGLAVGDSLQPLFRKYENGYAYIGSSSLKFKREGRYLLEQMLNRPLLEKEQCHHKNRNRLDDRKSNLVVLSIEDHGRYHSINHNPMKILEVKHKHLKILKSKKYRENHSNVMKELLRKDPVRWLNHLKGHQKQKKWPNSEVVRRFLERFPDLDCPLDNHIITKIEEVGYEDVYDMEIEKYHNFSVNGIFVHNSEEDDKGIPFCGKAGRRLEGELKKHDIDMRRDCWIINALSCRPPKNKIDDEKKIDYCRPLVFNAIKELKPEIILLLGKSALKSVVGQLWKDDVGPMERWVGWSIPSQELNAWILPTWHPSYLEREQNPAMDLWFRKHLESINQLEGRPWKNVPDYESQVEIITDPDNAADFINTIIDDGPGSTASFDLETTSLKPDSKRCEIVCCSICWEGANTFAFPWTGAVIPAMKRFLRSDIRKIGYNIKFEDRWIRKEFGFGVKNFIFDGMQAAHVLDCRRGITSVKFQSFVRLGMPSYNDHIEPFLRSKGTNELNRIKDVDLQDLLLYCGLDSLLEYKVAKQQMKELGI